MAKNPYSYKTDNPITWNGQVIPQTSGTSPNYIPSDEELWNNKAAWRRYGKEMAGGYGGAPTLTEYSTESQIADWWKNVAYKGGGASELLASSANALLPSFAADDQNSVAKWLGQNFKDFADYEKVELERPTQSSSELRNQFFSKERAQQALSDLEAMRTAMGTSEEQMGSGYAFLKKTISLLDKYGGDGTAGISRASFAAMIKEFEGLSGDADQSYVELARAFLNPSAGGSQLMQSFQANGRDTFGIPNTKLFT